MQNQLQQRSIRSYARRERRMNNERAQSFASLYNKYHSNFRAFDRAQPLILEIGFGYGEALLASAMQNPNNNYIGIEVYRPGVEKLLYQLEEQGMNNVAIFNEDAMLVLEQYIGDASLDSLRLFFPDPWPKRAHHKRRIVNPLFIDLIFEKLKANGFFHFATDWEDYAIWVQKLFQRESRFVAVTDENLNQYSDRVLTKFARAGIAAGRTICDLVFTKTGS